MLLILLRVLAIFSRFGPISAFTIALISFKSKAFPKLANGENDRKGVFAASFQQLIDSIKIV